MTPCARKFHKTFAEERAAGRKFLLQRETPVLPLSTSSGVAEKIRHPHGQSSSRQNRVLRPLLECALSRALQSRSNNFQIFVLRYGLAILVFIVFRP